MDLDISFTNILWAELLLVLAWMVCYPTGNLSLHKNHQSFLSLVKFGGDKLQYIKINYNIKLQYMKINVLVYIRLYLY